MRMQLFSLTLHDYDTQSSRFLEMKLNVNLEIETFDKGHWRSTNVIYW